MQQGIEPRVPAIAPKQLIIDLWVQKRENLGTLVYAVGEVTHLVEGVRCNSSWVKAAERDSQQSWFSTFVAPRDRKSVV